MKFAKFFVALSALAAFAAGAAAQVTPVTVQTLLSNTTYIGEVATTNISNGKTVEIDASKGFGIVVNMVGTNAASVTNMGFKVQTSSDGTNWENDPGAFIWHCVSPQGTTAVWTRTNIPPTVVDHVWKLRLLSITNNNMVLGKGIWVTNVYIVQ